jgi:hypothetical protein
MAITAPASGMTRQILEALARFATAQMRRLGIGAISPHWQARAAVCEQCPMRVLRCGVSYCGKPFLQMVNRDPALDGCGCPCHDKAKSPSEHCPIDPSHRAATTDGGHCTCKWCLEISRLTVNPR